MDRAATGQICHEKKLEHEGPTPYVWEGKEESPVFPPKMVLIAEVLQNVINLLS